MALRADVLIVDPQQDFVIADDGHGHKGSLVVPGAYDDMKRVATMIDRLGKKVRKYHVTLDSHQTFGIERPRWWVRVSDGSHVAPFTCLGIHPDGKRIVKVEFPGGVPTPTDEEYTTYVPSYLHNGGPVIDPNDPTGKKRLGSFGYLQALAKGGKYPHVVWPVHCCVGKWGWSVVEEVADALARWEYNGPARVDYVVKGNNPWTEHFSGVSAEVPDPDDPTTQVNTGLIETMEQADLIALTGEALSHCVCNTVRGIAANFSDPKFVQKLVLLTDASSNVSGFEFLGDAFIKDMKALGMQTSTTIDFLA